ncbi:hypothetical protein [Cupriavidus consociatus]|uniref:hypothetical protein n=1 Tax=Cupriavidus consociatus TaxID=2821357 RepID=UPI001AE816BC|nr:MULTISPECIES: hypothetical protein [unclassified Cupriavidus]MBP0624746.1 hypothetical protein [Cupriavidus sp. LEh25]MDK2661462.1 hypothetical protein [Cupriavidus sp. LEh21]
MHTLAALLDHHVLPTHEMDPESAADACLVQRQFDDALSGYFQLDTSTPRIATKVAFCEWMKGQADDARLRLLAYKDELESDGVGLLCQLILLDANYERRRMAMEAIWPQLLAATSADDVPVIAAMARARSWWPSDYDNPDQRLRELERLLTLHPDSQPLRLALLVSKQRAGAPAQENFHLLFSHSYAAPMPRYLWESAIVAAKAQQYDASLECLEQLVRRQGGGSAPSRTLMFNIALARCDVKAAKGEPSAFSCFDELLADASLQSDERLRVTRVALAAACRDARQHVDRLADDYLLTMEATDCALSIDAACLIDDSYPIDGDDWDTYGDSWPGGDLIPWRDCLLDVRGLRAQHFFRAAFTASEIEQKYDEDPEFAELPAKWWDSLGKRLGSVAGHEEEFGGRLLSLHTAVRAHRPRPTWSKIGKDWLASEALAKRHDLHTHGWLTLQAIADDEATARTFAAGVLKELAATAQIAAPMAYDLVADLARILNDLKVWRELHALLDYVAEDDARSHVQFQLGLAAHWINKNSEARTAYAAVLKDDPNHYAALFNSLLLCKDHSDTPYLDQLDALVARSELKDPEESKKLRDALAKARDRCKDKVAEKRELIRLTLAKFPPLRLSARPEDISLRAAVALLALFRCANAEPGDQQLRPFNGSGTPFSPTASCRQALFELLERGIVAVDEGTQADAFDLGDGRLSWYFGDVWWRMSPASADLVEQLRSLRGEIPESWRKDVLPLSMEIARGEITEYLNHLADERGWPEPGNTEEVSDLVHTLANELPVAQAFHLAYLGAMSASDYKQKYRVNGQQASNMLIKRTGQRLESLREGRFPARSYDRPWKLPRSAASLALWGTILDLGDSGFEKRVSDLTKDL